MACMAFDIRQQVGPDSNREWVETIQKPLSSTTVTREYPLARAPSSRVRFPGVYVSAYCKRTATLFETSASAAIGRRWVGPSAGVHDS